MIPKLTLLFTVASMLHKQMNAVALLCQDNETPTTVYLNDDRGVKVSVGPMSNPAGRFVNVGTAQSLANVISLDNETDSENHNQASHVWWRGVPLELVFDLGASYDIEAIHFWNYFTEQFDVDEISVSFRNENGESVSSLSLSPITGVNSAGNRANNIVAETFTLDDAAAVRVSEVSMLLSSTNGELDFNNIGFTASICTDGGAVPSLTPSIPPSDNPPSTTPSQAPSDSPALPAHCQDGVSAGSLFLNDDRGVKVSVGPMSNPAGRFHRIGAARALANVINLDSETDSENHNPGSHVWWRGVPLELVFDLGASYDIEAIHFWNYFTEQFDVDEISVSFRNENGESVSSLSLSPIKGVNSAGRNGNNIVAETFTLDDAAAVRVSEVSMLLSSTNGELDFNNIGFTARCTPASDVVTPAPTKSPMLPPGVGGFGCFSGDSVVDVYGKGRINVSQLRVGDRVAVARNQYEPVYSFGHRDVDVVSMFLRIVTERGYKLEVTEAHMVVTHSGKVIPASLVKVGDMLVTASDGAVAVREVHTVRRRGQYAPFTPSGLIVVDGLVASNYIAYEKTPCLTLAVHTCVSHQWLAHMFLSPLRLAYKVGAASDSPTSEGVNYRLALPHRLAVWLMGQDTATITIVLIPAIALFGVLFIVESFPLKLLVTAVLLVLLHYKSRMKGMKFVDNRKKTSE